MRFLSREMDGLSWATQVHITVQVLSYYRHLRRLRADFEIKYSAWVDPLEFALSDVQ